MDEKEVARRLQRIREEVREQLGPPAAADGEALPPEPELRLPEIEAADEGAGPGDLNLSSTPDLEAANRSAEIRAPIEITSDVPLLGPLLIGLRKLFRPLVQGILDPYLEWQERFNTHIVRHLNEQAARLERRMHRLEAVSIETRLSQALRDYDAALRQRHLLLFGILEEELQALQNLADDARRQRAAEVQRLWQQLVARSEVIDRRFAEQDRVIEGLYRPLDSAEVLGLRRRLGEVLERLDGRTDGDDGGTVAGRQEPDEGGKDRVGGDDGDRAKAGAEGGRAEGRKRPSKEKGDVSAGATDDVGAAGGVSFDEPLWNRLRAWMRDEDYRAFQNAFRGDEAEIRRRMRRHVERFAGIEGPIADLGCGRGEFLELLAEGGHRAIGVEINEAEVEECRRRGLEAESADLFDWLERREPASLGGVFLAQVIEHLAPPLWQRLLELAAARLHPGGRLVIETINPESLYALARAYVIDPTHVRPVHPGLLGFLARRCGFHPVEVDYQAPVPEDERATALPVDLAGDDAERVALLGALNERLERIDRLCCAPQEYTLSATLPASEGGAP